MGHSGPRAESIYYEGKMCSCFYRLNQNIAKSCKCNSANTKSAKLKYLKWQKKEEKPRINKQRNQQKTQTEKETNLKRQTPTCTIIQSAQCPNQIDQDRTVTLTNKTTQSKITIQSFLKTQSSFFYTSLYNLKQEFTLQPLINVAKNTFVRLKVF